MTRTGISFFNGSECRFRRSLGAAVICSLTIEIDFSLSAEHQSKSLTLVSQRTKNRIILIVKLLLEFCLYIGLTIGDLQYPPRTWLLFRLRKAIVPKNLNRNSKPACWGQHRYHVAVFALKYIILQSVIRVVSCLLPTFTCLEAVYYPQF